jgi:cytochrome c peroxidase
MHSLINQRIFVLLFAGIFLCGCQPDKSKVFPAPSPYAVDLPPAGLGFPAVSWPADNPATVEGIDLGRQLFYDKALSLDRTVACASCHLQTHAFTDSAVYSRGVNGTQGTRNAMPIFNMVWANRFFWDGRSPDLRDQVVQPVQDPLEMHLPMEEALSRLRSSEHYREMFGKAFGDETVNVERFQKALEQFVLSLTSWRSKFDMVRMGQSTFSASEQRGFDLFMREYSAPGSGRPLGADCFHCHGGVLFTNRLYENNGIDSVLQAGHQVVTGSAGDRGKFKTPSLRNVALTAPYMHDGRFANLEQVLDHYDHGVVQSNTLNANLRVQTGGLRLSVQDKADIIAFLHTLTDSTLATNPAYSEP